MTSELKVSNQFGEMILHIRLISGETPELLTIDATEEMRAAIGSLTGHDFDRAISKDNELLVLTAKWGSPEYASVLARYFVSNFGWSTKVVETGRPVAANCLAASGSLVSYAGADENLPFSAAAYCLIASLTADDPGQHTKQRRKVEVASAENRCVPCL